MKLRHKTHEGRQNKGTQKIWIFRAIGVIRGLFFEGQWAKVGLRVERASRGSSEVLRE